jgi:peptidoglycan hydrolase CwlO-like protein
MKKSLWIIVLIGLLTLSTMGQEKDKKSELPPDKDMQILELQITVLAERQEKLQAQLILVNGEREKLINQYKAKKAEAEEKVKEEVKEKVKDK